MSKIESKVIPFPSTESYFPKRLVFSRVGAATLLSFPYQNSDDFRPNRDNEQYDGNAAYRYDNNH